MKLYTTTLNYESAFVFAESVESAIAKFNRLRRILCLSQRLGYVCESDEVNKYRTQKAQQVQTLLGEEVYTPPNRFDAIEAQLRAMLLEVA